MALTLPTQLSAFPPIVPPDWAQCSRWFADAPVVNDCQIAFDNLPVNEKPISYRPILRYRSEPGGILHVETHGNCQLKLHASGQWVEENNFVLDISPNKIRNMFGQLMEKCVQGERSGGFVTSGLKNTIDWILREDTEFPGEPPKRPGWQRNLYIPESATFLTAMIWQPPPDVFQFEPGANYPVVGEILYKALQKASKDLESKDPHSAFARELRNREEFIWFIVVDHQHIPDPPYWTWWGDQRGSSPRGDVPVSENGSLTLLNATGLQVENTTSV